MFFCSLARGLLQQSSSSGDLLPEMMESEMPPPISSPNRADDFEVSSQRVSPDQQVVRGMMKTQPEGDTSVAQGPGTNNKGPEHSGLYSRIQINGSLQREVVLLQQPPETQSHLIY